MKLGLYELIEIRVIGISLLAILRSYNFTVQVQIDKVFYRLKFNRALIKIRSK